MKQILRDVIPTLFILGSLSGCNSNQCNDVQCLNGGVCTDGTCDCPEGFAGNNCQYQIDPCNGNACSFNGECVNGQCICYDGFEGDGCEIVSANRFVGEHNASENCGGASSSYQLYITNGMNSITELELINLHNSGEVVYAYVDESTFNIPSQFLGDPSMTISGSGYMNGPILTINFTISGSENVSCTMVNN